MKQKLLSLLSLVTLLTLSSYTDAQNKKPFVVPELQEWVGKSGNFNISEKTTLSVSSNDSKELLAIAKQFRKDIETMFGTLIVEPTNSGKKNIHFELSDVVKGNDEAYSIDIASNITIKANKPIGAYWATRTLLQIMESSNGKALPKGKIIDYPSYPFRCFMLDAGRKFFSAEFIRDYVKFMSYYKMNVFHLHLNDNGFKQYFGDDWMNTQSAFRLESDTYPGLAAKDGYYTKDEFREIESLAKENYVTIIPEIDIPAHVLAFTQYKPELGSKIYGMDHLDLFNPETYKFFDKLFEEYLGGDNPVFNGEYMHIGTDEYSNKDKEVVEKFRYFTDYYIKEAEKYGKKVAVWGSLTHAKGKTPVKSENVLMYCWSKDYSLPSQMMNLGYDIVSIPDGMVYIVPSAGYYRDYLDCKSLYNNWTPAVNVGNEVFEENNPHIKGGAFAVWNDHCGNGITAQDVHDRVFPAMQTMSQKMWKGKLSNQKYEDFDAKRKKLSEAPGLNMAGILPKEILGKVIADTLTTGKQVGIKEVGYPYSVDFDLTTKDNVNGAVLFEGPHSKLYLRHPQTGKLAFQREYYLDCFNYTVPNDKTIHVRIVADNNSTSLFIDNEKIETLERERVVFNQNSVWNSRLFKMHTFFFPLEKIGRFKGTICNLIINQPIN